jgi:hypothetical protein
VRSLLLARQVHLETQPPDDALLRFSMQITTLLSLLAAVAATRRYNTRVAPRDDVLNVRRPPL